VYVCMDVCVGGHISAGGDTGIPQHQSIKQISKVGERGKGDGAGAGYYLRFRVCVCV